MRVLGIVGPSDSGKTALVEQLVGQLTDRGQVASVKHLTSDPMIDTDGKDTARHQKAGAAATYGISEDVGWFATGQDRTLQETLDDLAPAYEYALVEGYSQARIPTVALGGRDHAGETVATAPDVGAVDATDLVEALENLEPYETLESLVADVNDTPAAELAGAVATFTGRVRRKDSHDDDPTERLEFEKYDGVADERIAALRTELEARDGIHAVRLHHRTGIVEAGDDIVFVVVLAGHRSEAFETVEDGIDRLKDEVPLFKKEVTVTDTYWAHERDE
jgi:molybdopterin synthase catalytic subunit